MQNTSRYNTKECPRLRKTISENNQLLQNNSARIVHHLQEVQRIVRRNHELSEQRKQDELRLALLDANYVYVHILVDFDRNRILRIQKGKRDKRYGELRFFFGNLGGINLSFRGAMIPLRIGRAQEFDLDSSNLMVTAFLSYEDAQRSVRTNSPF